MTAMVIFFASLASVMKLIGVQPCPHVRDNSPEPLSVCGNAPYPAQSFVRLVYSR
jgi:hypothetical protein